MFTQHSVMKTSLCTNLSLYIPNVLESAKQEGLPHSSRSFFHPYDGFFEIKDHQ